MSTKAVILVGGPSSGTRFRPLSMDCAKPLFPIAGNATIYHHVLALSKLPSMHEIILIGFWEQPVFDRFLSECQLEFPQVSFRYSARYPDTCGNTKPWAQPAASTISETR